MSKIFILMPAEGDDYSSLPNDKEHVVLFRYIKGPPNIEHIEDKLREVLDNCDVDNDFIVFNGPAYLCAIAGYIWFTHVAREKHNFYAFNVKENKYIPHTESMGG